MQGRITPVQSRILTRALKGIKVRAQATGRGRLWEYAGTTLEARV